MKSQRIANAAIDLLIFMAATGGTYFAQTLDRPITAVLVFLSGVIVIAVHSGLTNGLIAAFCASLIYNFFLSEPAYEFGLTSADEAVPLFAFNFTAILAGALIGRVRDAAQKASLAQSETAFLLTISDRLQTAIDVGTIEKELRSILPTQGVRSVEIFLAEDDHYVRASTGEIERDRLRPLLDGTDETGEQSKVIFLELDGTQGPIGIVKFVLDKNEYPRSKVSDLRSVAALLALAIERCLLLQKVAESQASARLENLKDAVLSSISHDLRTPITAIETAAGALSNEDIVISEEDRRALLGSILEQCVRLDRYTSDLLDVGQIQTGFDTTRFETIEVREVLHAVRVHAAKAHPSVSIEYSAPENPVFVRANAVMLEQAVFNILDNACKFGGEAGPVGVLVDIDGDQAVITVSDCGPGISEAEASQVFERFFQSSHAGSRGGNGLGLFIAKGFVEAFGGTIRATKLASVDKGASFVVRLPIETSIPELKDVA